MEVDDDEEHEIPFHNSTLHNKENPFLCYPE